MSFQQANICSKKVIVTLLIGKYYRDRWNKLCAANWQQYANRHGYDLICIDQPLDTSERAQSRSAAWQKCLILSEPRIQKYDRVVWIDSDILINPHSPCIVSDVPIEKIGVVDMFAQLNELLPGEEGRLVNRHAQFWHWLVYSPQDFYKRVGFTMVPDRAVQTGVMVLSPGYHRSLLEETYYDHEDLSTGHFEMESLSYEIVKANIVHWLDYRFNTLWVECMLKDYLFLAPSHKLDHKLARGWKRLVRGHTQLPPQKITTLCLTNCFINHYFLHFAGMAQYMHWVDTSISSWQALQARV